MNTVIFQRGVMRDTIVRFAAIRRVAIVALFSLAPVLCWAATRGPDAGGYLATDATVYSFVDISTGGAASVLAGADDATAVLTLPFTFHFYGTSYTQVCVSSNGALYFVTATGACSGIADFANTDLTITAVPGDLPAVLPFWSDLTFQVPGSGAVFYQTTGAPGTRKFIVQWNNAYPQGSPNPVTFQVILSEGTNRLLFQYKTVDLGGANPATRGSDATIGIRNAGAVASAQQIEWSFDVPVILNESALLFSTNVATPVVPSITVTGGTFTYDGAVHAATATATGTGGVAVSGSFSFGYGAGGSAAPVNAGVYAVTATFTSNDPGYTNASGGGTIAIQEATPIITWANPAAISEGTPLSATQLNATANAAGTFAYTPPVGTVLDGGLRTLNATFTPSNPANYNSAAKAVTINVLPTAGVMDGNGRTDASGIRYEFSFHVAERASGAERGRLSLEVDRLGLETRGNHIGTFVSSSLDQVVFTDDPRFRPSYRPRPTIDTATLSGSGRWNGVAGYTFTAQASDAGEPGAGRDRLTLTIRNPAGAVVATVGGTITAGNIQSSRLAR